MSLSLQVSVFQELLSVKGSVGGDKDGPGCCLGQGYLEPEEWTRGTAESWVHVQTPPGQQGAALALPWLGLDKTQLLALVRTFFPLSGPG